MTTTVSEDVVTQAPGLVSKITNFLSTKRGMYIIATVVLLGAIYYYTQYYKKDDKKELEQPEKQQSNDQQQQEYQPPPGYVTIPVEMLQGLQQGQMYQEIPQNINEQQMQFQTQEPHPQQNDHHLEEQRREVPTLRHNQQIDDNEEDDEIAAQNLSKEEMASIQAQLNAMQQQRGASNSA